MITEQLSRTRLVGAFHLDAINVEGTREERDATGVVAQVLQGVIGEQLVQMRGPLGASPARWRRVAASGIC